MQREGTNRALKYAKDAKGRGASSEDDARMPECQDAGGMAVPKMLPLLFARPQGKSFYGSSSICKDKLGARQLLFVFSVFFLFFE